jgi:hypothetical protein
MLTENSMEFHAVEFHGINRLMEFHGIPWNFVNSWNSMEFGFNRVDPGGWTGSGCCCGSTSSETLPAAATAWSAVGTAGTAWSAVGTAGTAWSAVGTAVS